MTTTSRPLFPFTAVTGHERLKLALILAALDTRLGGVLVSGPRGTAKSTLARGLAELLPFSRSSLVTLPLGADEAQLTGTLDLGRALGDREVAFQPGLLARAHEGALYIDEVNLLPDALVDLLLDVAASGINHVERDGISHQHPADFLLIGTMNPDEGELRAQLLDRFGLAVLDHPAPDIEQRLQIVERRLAFDRDPETFMFDWQEEQDRLCDRLSAARERLSKITLPAELARVIATRCVNAGVEGVRADLAWRRGALAHAAWQGRDVVTLNDIETLAPLVMAHRAPGYEPHQAPDQGNNHGGQGGGDHRQENDEPSNSEGETSSSATSAPPAERYQGRLTPPDAPARPDMTSRQSTSSPAEQTSSTGNQQHQGTHQDQDDHDDNPHGNGDWGNLPAHQASLTLDSAASGHIQLPSIQTSLPASQRAAQTKGRRAIGRARIDWPGSLRKAAISQGHSVPGTLEALAWQRERRRPERLTCIVLDISGSSLSRQTPSQRTRQLEKAMSLIARLAFDAYLARERLMLITLGGEGVTEVMAPRRAPRSMAPVLNRIKPGGGTPLRRGLDDTRQRLARLHDDPAATRLWILTDARSRDDLEPAPFGLETHIVDCEPRGEALGRAKELATALEATCHDLDDLIRTPTAPAMHANTTTVPGRQP